MKWLLGSSWRKQLNMLNNVQLKMFEMYLWGLERIWTLRKVSFGGVCVCLRERVDEDKVTCRMAELFIYIFWFCLESGMIIFCLLVALLEWRYQFELYEWCAISEIMNVHMWMHVRVSLRARTCVQACMRDCPLRYFGPRSFPRPLSFFFSLNPFALNTWIPSFHKAHISLFSLLISSHTLPTCQLA